MKFNLVDNSYHWSLMIGGNLTLNCITQSSLHTLYNDLLWFKQRSYSNRKELHRCLSPIHFSYVLDMPSFKAPHQFQLIHVLYSLATHQGGLADLLYFWQFISNNQSKGNSSLSSWKQGCVIDHAWISQPLGHIMVNRQDPFFITEQKCKQSQTHMSSHPINTRTHILPLWSDFERLCQFT
jgi:hypothetical protein